MRVYEILNEDDGGNDVGKGGSSNKRGKAGKVHDHHAAAIKGLETYGGNDSYYTMYRFGIDMARGPNEHHPYDQSSAIGNQMATLAYTDAEQKIIDNSKKNMGLTSKKLTSKDSKEHPNVHTVSPVAKIKRNKYGI
jgi:hypothetical protein